MNLNDPEILNTISTIQAQYLCCVPIRRINWKNFLQDLNWDNQKYLLDHTVKLESLKKYPLQTKYTLRFIRHIIDYLESTNQEVHDDFYETYCQHQAYNNVDSKFSYRHFKINGYTDTIILKESNNNITDGTTGLSVWGAAFALVEWAILHKKWITDLNVLELGAGTGFCGLLIGRICKPKSILLSDGNAKVLDCLNENVRINFNDVDKGSIGVIDINWCEVEDANYAKPFSKLTKVPNLLIASDIVYDNSLFRPLCQTIDYIFDRCQNQCLLILANAIRNENTQKDFFDIIAEFGFAVRDEPLQPPTHLYWAIDFGCPMKIYAISRNSAE